MAKVTYEASDLNAIITAASSARAAGKTWNDAFVCAQKAGYKGALSSLQKLIRAQPVADVPNPKPSAPAGYKNSAKSVESAVTGANAFSKSKPQRAAESALTSSISNNPETLDSIQNRLPVLREGAHYTRPISLFQGSFHNSSDGEIIAWSRILEKEEAVCVTNSNAQFPRGADVLVDCTLNPIGGVMTVIHVTDANAGAAESDYAIGMQLPVQRRADGTAFVAVRDISPAATLVLSNSPAVLASMA
jgi:hypothetical protein